MKRAFIFVLTALLAGEPSAAERQCGAEPDVLYTNDFEAAEVGRPPEGFLVLDGRFTVREEEGNKVLHLPGAPLETFGALFGPARGADWEVCARIRSEARGRRFPTFGVGLNGIGGYRLQVSPARKAIELSRLDEVIVSEPFQWKTDSWTHLRLQLVKLEDGKWRVQGKAWPHGGAEPEDWMVSVDETSKPAAGRASVWGIPFSGEPILFDDLVIRELK